MSENGGPTTTDGPVPEGTSGAREFANVYWHPHFLVAALWFAWPLLVPLLALVTLLASPTAVGALLAIGAALLVLYGGVGGALGYYLDAKDMREAGLAYRPNWRRWIVAHVVLTPLVASPLYLYLRREAIGSPSLEDMRHAATFWLFAEERSIPAWYYRGR